ncbi:MAG: phosphoribosylglycinamide formyltransferase [Proteobacteria bacterium]|nr:phosphoribosylglycinamide formyltransferase [Pseudomonadota bacterium]
MKKLGILVSGRGSNMAAIINACEQGKLSASVEVVISSNPDSLALVLAEEKKINTAHLGSHTHPNPDALDAAMKDILYDHKVDYVLLAGFMKKIGPKMLLTYRGKIINIHPSLLPKFGGRGMYGINVHKAVIDAGEKESGVTIHLVDGEYDEGAILAQQCLIIEPEDTPASLAAKILKIEHVLYAETIQKIIDDSIILPGN